MITWYDYVSKSLDALLIGTHKVSDVQLCVTVRELLDDARYKSGVYGEDNLPVDGDMTVGDLTDWHADYVWRILGPDAEMDDCAEKCVDERVQTLEDEVKRLRSAIMQAVEALDTDPEYSDSELASHGTSELQQRRFALRHCQAVLRS